VLPRAPILVLARRADLVCEMGKAVTFGAVRGDDEDPRPVDGSQGPQFIGGLERANHKGCAIEIHRLGVLAVLLSGRSRFPPRGDDVADRGESQHVSTAPVATKLVSRVHCGPETLVEGKSREVVALELSQEVAEADLMSRVPVGSELRLELRGQHPEVGTNGRHQCDEELRVGDLHLQQSHHWYRMPTRPPREAVAPSARTPPGCDPSRSVPECGHFAGSSGD
jgi:hypothetical protein